jgi:GTP-binding protein
VSLLHRASFFVSAAQLNQLPAPSCPEICFVGRSNSGKSSAINLLTNQRRLAFSSKTPGRTRLINMFGLPDPNEPERPLGFLVDLPGYGYAAISQEQRELWAKLLGGYLATRTALIGVVLLIDIRRGITPLDHHLIDFIVPTGRPLLILLTKADKLPYGQRLRAILTITKALPNLGIPLHTIPFSVPDRLGLADATAHLENWLLPQIVP